MCPHSCLLREPTSPETPGQTWFPLLEGGPSPSLPFFHLIVFVFVFSFTHNWLMSLREPGNKEPQAAILAGESLSLQACTAFLGTTDLCSFVWVILPFCVNYALPASFLSPPQSDYFRHPPSLASLANLLSEPGPISRHRSRFIYPSQVRGLICSARRAGPGRGVGPSRHCSEELGLKCQRGQAGQGHRRRL